MAELLSSFEFKNYSLETGVDITDKDAITQKIISDSDAAWVFHLAAYTNVQKAETDREAAELVNVTATQHIVDACRKSGKRLLYVDTDYAFDGKKKEGYAEEDTPHPLCWYARTKSEGAKRVLAYDKGLVIRISNPYRAHPTGKTDFVHKILERLTSGQDVTAPADQLFVPTFVDDVAAALRTLVSVNASGIYHVTSGSVISPFEASKIIAQTYGCDTGLVRPTTFAAYFEGRAPIPQYAVLLNNKITKLGVSMHDFRGGIKEVYDQEMATG
ncbi:MAG: NAD(P)-dependent oxidoreductase [Chloroflexi bacterium]|nr:NAD(P)-dependent oxidoreductase [Chloroflexota bacterium]